MQICDTDKCTGCYACVNACMRNCISMKEDEYGAIKPSIDESSCVQCGMCIKACPNNTPLEFKYPQNCYAAWIKDKVNRRICASGGLGTSFSEYVIKQGGVVYGSCYDNQLIPHIQSVEAERELVKFKGSRYVQSLVGEHTYRDVKKRLLSGRMVLYIGTPCQIAGLKTYLRKEYDNLVTVDLICHGVCPTKYLNEEVGYLSGKYGLKNVSDIRFRGNDGNNFRLTLWDKHRKRLFPRNNFCEKLLHLDDVQQYYIMGFLLGVTLRENCFTCNYARPERISDITIGDFIGLGKMGKFEYSKNNVSSVFINTDKGRRFYDDVCKINSDLVSIEREYEERLLYAPSLLYPYPRHELNPVFKENYQKYGYVEGIRKTLKKEVHLQQINRFINLWTYSYRIPRKIYKIFTEKRV